MHLKKKRPDQRSPLNHYACSAEIMGVTDTELATIHKSGDEAEFQVGAEEFLRTGPAPAVLLVED